MTNEERIIKRLDQVIILLEKINKQNLTPEEKQLQNPLNPFQVPYFPPQQPTMSYCIYCQSWYSGLHQCYGPGKIYCTSKP